MNEDVRVWAYVEKPDGEVVKTFIGFAPYIGRPILFYEGKLCSVVGIEFDKMNKDKKAWH